MSEINPQRKKVAVLAASICTLNMPFLLLVEHMHGTKLEVPLVVFYVVAMAVLIVYVVKELVKLKRGGR